jgi:SAM-dependent methyltransferase
LEHVPDPKAVMYEVQRVLKPEGKLFLSVPFNAPLHGEPWHFFQFTHYGIAQLAEEAGLNIVEIEKIGGSFWNLGKRLPDTFRKLLKQYDPFRAKKRGMSPGFCVIMNILLSPVWIFVYLPSAYLIRPIFYWMDYLDLEKSFTLGYTAVLQKE